MRAVPSFSCSFAYFTSPSSCSFRPTALPMLQRSKSSVVVPTYQPRFTSPTMFLAGTRTSVKNTSLNMFWFARFVSGRTSTPGDFMSSRK